MTMTTEERSQIDEKDRLARAEAKLEKRVDALEEAVARNGDLIREIEVLVSELRAQDGR
jgi:hypothetical protein